MQLAARSGGEAEHMHHPLESLSSAKRGGLFGILLALTMAVMGVLNAVDRPLTTDAAPHGIVSFELAGDVSAAREILDSWATVRAEAGFSLGFDFVFLAAYSTTIALACVWAARILGSLHAGLPPFGLWLAWGQWLAALFDIVENGALMVQLLETPRTPWPQVAYWCAVPKFGLVLLGLVYAALGAIWWLVRRR